MTGRPIARWVIGGLLLLLGAMAARRLEVAYLPTWSFPEIFVRLDLPRPSEVDQVTRRWVEPLEGAIRALGGVRSTSGEVHTRGAWLLVRFAAGQDPETKAARLESELAGLRRRLPEAARLEVRPAGRGGGDRAVVLGIENGTRKVGRAFFDAVRALPEVRRLDVAGEPRHELRITAHPGGDAAAIDRAVTAAPTLRHLGTASLGERRIAVLDTRPGARDLRMAPVLHGDTLLPLDALAELELGVEPSIWNVRTDGRRARVLLIDREDGTSPLALERALRRTLERFDLTDGARFLYNEADPLRALLARAALGLAAAVVATALLAGLLGGWRAAAAQALALPAALAAALNAWVLGGLSLDVTTLPILAVALGGCLVVLAFRGRRWTDTGIAAVTLLATAALFPVAVALAGGRLAPIYLPPARAFLLAQVAGVVALLLVPRPRLDAARGRRVALARPIRAALRRPWTVLLGTLSVTGVLYVGFGGALGPRGGDLSPAAADLRLDLRFAAGTTPAQAERQIALAESALAAHDEVERHWSAFTKGRGWVAVSVRPEERSAARLRRLAGRLRRQLGALGSSAEVTALAAGAGGGGEPIRFSDELGARPEVDRELLTRLRFLLRSSDLDDLVTAHEDVVHRLVGIWGISGSQVLSDWERPEVRVELAPRRGASPDAVRAAAAAVRARANRPARRELPSLTELGLRLFTDASPRSDDEVPSRAALLGLRAAGAPAAHRLPGAVLAASERLGSPTLRRQSGRFVVPITVLLRGTFPSRVEQIHAVSQSLRNLPLAAGTDVELPPVSPTHLSRERLRLLALAATLPLLLLVAATVRLNALGPGGLALVPGVVGLAAAAPWIHATRGHVDEMTLFALAAVTVAAVPLALEILAAPGGAAPATGVHAAADYRWLLGRMPAIAVATIGLTLLVGVPTLGIDGDRHPWAVPMSVAAVAAAASTVASLLCLPGLRRAALHWRDRPARRARRRATRDAWREAGPLELEVRRVSKVYGDGFQALRSLDLYLGPGIIGLLGPNGAGKTTLLRILCGLLEPSRGQVSYRGRPITPESLPEYRRLVGFLPQGFNAYAGFTGERFLDYWALEKGIRDPAERRREVERRLAEVGLEAAAGRKVRDYSGGMRRRIGIARALLGDPPIVLVDEPTTGLDVESRRRLRDSLLRVAGQRIILFSTHIAADVDAAAARILLLDGGRLLYDGPARGLIERAHGAVFEALIDDAELRELSTRYRVTTRVRTLDGLRVRAVSSDGAAPPGEIVEPNLEEAYLALIGRHGGRHPGRGGDPRRPAAALLDLES